MTIHYFIHPFVRSLVHALVHSFIDLFRSGSCSVFVGWRAVLSCHTHTHTHLGRHNTRNMAAMTVVIHHDWSDIAQPPNHNHTRRHRNHLCVWVGHNTHSPIHTYVRTCCFTLSTNAAISRSWPLMYSPLFRHKFSVLSPMLAQVLARSDDSAMTPACESVTRALEPIAREWCPCTVLSWPDRASQQEQQQQQRSRG